jgi:GTP-binding protein
MPEAGGDGLGEKAWLKRGHLLFAQECTFLRAVSAFEQLTTPDIPEVAFAGRSNVGKSSLINAITNRNSLARVSNTPGRTKEIIQFDLGGRLTLADLPGYGFAKVSKAVSENWHRLIETYLNKRPQLRRVCLLVDARHPPHASDLLMMELLDGAAMSYAVVLTKLDKLKSDQRARSIHDVQALIQHRSAAHPVAFLTSAETKEGVPELRAHLARLANPIDKSYKGAKRGKR